MAAKVLTFYLRVRSFASSHNGGHLLSQFDVAHVEFSFELKTHHVFTSSVTGA